MKKKKFKYPDLKIPQRAKSERKLKRKKKSPGYSCLGLILAENVGNITRLRSDCLNHWWFLASMNCGLFSILDMVAGPDYKLKQARKVEIPRECSIFLNTVFRVRTAGETSLVIANLTFLIRHT